MGTQLWKLQKVEQRTIKKEIENTHKIKPRKYGFKNVTKRSEKD